MQMTVIFNRLIDVVKYWAIIQSVDEIKPESRFGGHLGLDSLEQLEVLMEVEKEFGIEISDEEAETIVTVGDAVALVQAKLAPNVELSGGAHEQATYASRLRKPLDVEQRALLERQLKRDDLQIFTVVRMAQKDIDNGDYDMALSRLRMDADKLHDEKELYAIIRYYFD